ncbi:MAG: alpha/beta hydrolase [Mariprofundaceae bacterium]|nr:alpha/beta hydrolase [Mariprofundaceae bacterium]
MQAQPLEKVIVETGEKPDASIIWLHGLGADGHDFEPIVPELGLPDHLAIRFIFPHAPAIPVSINNGYIMPAWYDFKQTDLGIEHDEKGISRSAKQIQLLIEQQEMHGIAPDRIILAGFSQGGAMAIHCGLRQAEPLAGIMALSAYLLLPNQLEDEMKDSARNVPIFMAHGVDDPVVPCTAGEASRRKLEKAGCRTEWHNYPMEHHVCPQEIKDIGWWIREALKKKG